MELIKLFSDKNEATNKVKKKVFLLFDFPDKTEKSPLVPKNTPAIFSIDNCLFIWL